ncbi:MAG: two-component regulator propeller domain-containing protein, partial [Bacteroidota bacterium]
QDDNGFIWVGTRRGMARFDPRTDRLEPIKLYSKGEEKEISCIFQDSQQQVWVGTVEGLFKLTFQPENSRWSASRINLDQFNFSRRTCKSIIEDHEGRIWCSFSNQIKEFSEGGLVFIDGSEIKEILQVPAENPNRGVETLVLLGDSTLLTGSVHRGVGQVSLNSPSLQLTYNGAVSGLPHPYVMSLLPVPETHAFWAGTYQGPAFSIGGVENLIPFPLDEPAGPVHELLFTQEGHIWMSSKKGLWQFLPRGQPFQNFTTNRIDSLRLPYGDVFGICETRNEEVWIIMYDKGLARYCKGSDGTWYRHMYTPKDLGLPSAHMIGIDEGKEGALWVTSFIGLIRLELPPVPDPANPPPPIVTRWGPSADGLKTPYIVKAYQEEGGNWWLSDYTGGLTHVAIEEDKLTVLKRFLTTDHPEFGPLDNRPGKIQQDQAGNLWVMSNLGMSRLSLNGKGEGRFRHFFLPPVDSANRRGQEPREIIQESDSSFWVGSAGGLFHIILQGDWRNSPWSEGISPFLSIQVEHFDEDDGLTNRSIYEILEDRKGNLWISHNAGIDKFDPKTWSFRNYNIEDGLQGNEFSENAVAKGKDGFMYFGGLQGVSRFHPDSLTDESIKPRAVIQEVRLYNQPLVVGEKHPQSKTVLDAQISHTQQLNLSWRDDVIGFDFTAIGFTEPGRYEFAYKLEGLDEAWQEIGTRRFATYTNLAPGDYTLLVKAANEDGIWQTSPTKLRISVSTPPWQSIWAYLLYAALVVAGIYELIRYRTQEVRRELALKARIEQAKLEEREVVRARSSRDFHDESGNKITKISLYTGLLKQRLAEQPESAAMLQKIEDNVQALSGGMRDFIWSLDPTKDSLADMAGRLQDFGVKLFEDTPTEFSLVQEVENSEEISLELNLRRQLILVFKEAMNNSLKYAGAGQVDLLIQGNPNRLSFYLDDNGKGFDPETLPRINGLENMKSRVGELGGEFVLNSTPGKGTWIQVHVPLR